MNFYYVQSTLYLCAWAEESRLLVVSEKNGILNQERFDIFNMRPIMVVMYIFLKPFDKHLHYETWIPTRIEITFNKKQ